MKVTCRGMNDSIYNFSMPTIKHYSNRKLYNTQTRRYVNLEEIANMVQNGEEVQILDHKSGADLTAATLLQVILDLEKRIGSYIPNSMLARLIQTSNVAFSHLRGALNGAFDFEEDAINQEINRRLITIKEEGFIGQEEYEKLKDQLTHRRFDPLNESQQINNKNEEYVQLEELHGLIDQVRNLEHKLHAIQSLE